MSFRRLLMGLVMVATSSAASFTFAQITGVVRDSATSDPIEDAIVTLQSTALRTTTDVGGNYSLTGAAAVSGTVTFVVAGPELDEFGQPRSQITRASGSFIADGYVRGMEITVSGSMLNDGVYRIAIVSADTLDLDGFYELIGEGPSAGVTITNQPQVIVAAREGYFNGSIAVPGGSTDIDLEPFLPSADPDYTFLSEFQCGFCHPKQLEQWTDSPMQLAGLNAWVYDVYNGTGTPGGMGGFVYTIDSVHAATFPAAECASCHQPEAFVQDPFNTPLADLAAPSAAALRGVSCETCHKVADVNESLINATGIVELNGAVTFIRPTPGSPGIPGESQIMFGVLGDVDFVAQPVMRAAYNPDMTHETCATCHQYNNDHDKDFDWEEPGSVPAQETWAEWKNSDYGDPLSASYATCADCHMAPFSAVPISTCDALFPPIERDPDTLHTHDIRGTTPFFLDNSVELDGEASQVGNVLTVDIDATNTGAGHSVPTGITLRNVILRIEAFDTDGDPLPYTGTQTIREEGGLGDSSLGYYGGDPGKLYGKILGDGFGERVIIFTEAFETLYDERIEALATDSTSYTFEVPAGEEVGEIRARLIYRRAYRDLIDAKGWTETGQGEPLADLQPPYYGHLMEELLINPPEAVSDVVFAGELPSIIDSVSALQSSLEANGRVVEVVTELTAASVAGAERVWVVLGTFPDRHQLTTDEGQLLADLTQAGTPIYLESGDYYFFDPAVPFNDYDGGNGLVDGNDTLIGLTGLDSGFGLDATGLDAVYTQDQAASDWTDQLEPVGTDLGGPNSGALWADDTSGGGSGYTVGIYYDSSFAPVLTQSFEFGGFGGDQVGLAALYLDGLNPLPPPPTFDRGNCNGDLSIDIGDPIFTLDILFGGGGTTAPCDDACDSNDDGGVDIADAINSLTQLFGGGAGFPAPTGACGVDPTPDSLGCAVGCP